MIKAKEESIKVGIIGYGRMGKIRADSSIKNGAVVYAVYDPDFDKLQEIKETHSEIEIINDFNAFPWSKIDVVFICSPPKYHLHHIKVATQENIPFLVEKPLGLNADEFKTLIDVIKEKKLLNAIGYMNRYRKTIEECKEKLKVSTPLGATAYWINSKYNVAWWSNIEESGGPFNEQATHLIDICRHLFGEVDSLKTFAKKDENGLIVSASVNFSFPNNCLVNILYSCEAKSKQIGLKLFTVEKEITLFDWDFKLDPNQFEEKNEIFDRETFYFLKAVKDSDSSLIRCDIEDAIKTQRIVDMIHDSIVI